MKRYTIDQLKKISWIYNSSFFRNSFDSSYFYLPDDLIIAEKFENENLSSALKTIKYFNSEPENFLDYIRKLNQKDFDDLILDLKGREYEFILEMKEFNSVDGLKLCEWAAKKRNLNILKYAREDGYPWNRDVTYWAAANGDLNILKYAHENGCPWDEGTTANAVQGNHLEVLKWLHENGCPWDYSSWDNAKENENEEIIDYLTKNGCPTEYVDIFSPFKENSIEFMFISELNFNTNKFEKESIIKKQKRFLDLLDYANNNGFCWLGKCDDFDFVDVEDVMFQQSRDRDYEFRRDDRFDQRKFLNLLYYLYNNDHHWILEKKDINLIKFLLSRGFRWN
jgi:hypothetical protein